MSNESNGTFVSDRQQDTFGGEVVETASPATQLVLGYLLATLVVGGLVGLYLHQNPTLFGEAGYARLAGLVVLGVTVIGTVRLAIKYVVLHRTRYIVTTDSVRRQYHLAYREEVRELPLHMIRGVELSRGRLQAMLGFATISFLAVGSNRGIGYVEFDNAAEPERLQDAVLELLEAQRDEARSENDGDSRRGTSGRSRPSTNRETPTANATSDPGADTTESGVTDDAPSTPDAGDREVIEPADSTTDPIADDGSTRNARRPVSGNDDGSTDPDAST